MGTYITKLGFNGTQFGNAYSTTAIGAIIAPLLVGTIADRFFEGQRLLGILHLLGGLYFYWVTTSRIPVDFSAAALLCMLHAYAGDCQCHRIQPNA